MKSILLHSIFTVLVIGSGYGQIESFEGEIAGDTTFTVLFNLVDGIDFISTGDLFIEVRPGLGCDGSDSYLGTVTGDGGSSGNFGSIKVANPDQSFTVSTSTPWCVFLSPNDGRNGTTGDVKFTGTESNGDTLEETIHVVHTSGSFDSLLFSAEIWEAKELIELEISMVSDIDYIALDNLVFENTVSTAISNIQEEEIILYPNPTPGQVKILGDNELDITIHDAYGRIVRPVSSYNDSMDISDLSKGVYFISFYRTNKLVTKPIIKI